VLKGSGGGGSSPFFVPVHADAVRDIKLSRNGEYVLTASLDKTAKVTTFDRNNIAHTCVILCGSHGPCGSRYNKDACCRDGIC
jgi:WD40 repeat protein